MVNLVNGEVLEGWLPAFSPHMTELELYAMGDDGKQHPRSINIEEIAYICMHDIGEFFANKLSKAKKMDELIVITVTAKRFKILAFPAEPNAAGFYAAVSKQEKLPFERIFFYFHGIRYQENSEQLGHLMVEQHLVSENDVEWALEQQKKLLIPIGDILAEQGKVSEEEIREALERQKRQQVRLGDLLIEQNLVSADEVQEALEMQTQTVGTPLGHILVEQGKLTNMDLDAALIIQRRPRMKLGELLLEAGLITEKDLQHALQEQKTRGRRLGEILLESHIITEDQLLTALAKKFSLSTVNLDEYDINPLAGAEIDQQTIERYRILPIQTDAHSLTVALADPMGLEAYDMIRFKTGKKVKEVLVKSSQLNAYLNKYLQEEIQAEELSCEFLQKDEDEQDDTFNEIEVVQSAEHAPIIRLVNRIIRNGLLKKASDIHILPQAKKVNLAYRLNGDLISENALDKSLHNQIAARVKILAGMDISERRLPQDGRMLLRDGKSVYEFRVSCIPNSFGESIVMRVLNKEMAVNLDTLGLRHEDLKRVAALSRKPYGLILVTGPTGSGKSTTLFAILKSIAHLPAHILTIEDPVESDIDGANQIQVNQKIGMTFARILRNVLRHDPDIIMLGEMRDQETAEIGIEAALTGHLLFSTLHTNSAIDTIIRLNDLGIPNYLIAPSLLGIISQNLVKKLCVHCRQELPKESDTFRTIKDLGLEVPEKLYSAGSCEECNRTGYSGRVMLYEMLTVDDRVRQAIHENKKGEELLAIAVKGGMIPKAKHALQLASEGIIDHYDFIRSLI